MKRMFYLLLLLIVASSYSQNEKLTVTRLDSMAINADAFVGFDGFNNCIYIKNSVLYKKIDSSILQYQNLGMGKITKVDITNPLKIIVSVSYTHLDVYKRQI